MEKKKRNRFLMDLLFIIFFFSFINIHLAQNLKLINRNMTTDEFYEYRRSVGTYEEGKNYNEIINGHGTGLRPPTEEQWEEMENKPFLIDKIEYPLRKISTPASHDNSATIWFPPIGHQGGEGSCVSWACVYYVKTFQEAKEHNWDLSGCIWTNGHPSSLNQDKIFSPDFVYHQINYGSDNGSGYGDNMNLLEQIGCCTWDKMPNDPVEHIAWPSENAYRQAPWYRSQTGYGNMMIDTDLEIEDLKQLLVNDNLAVISVDADFYKKLSSKDLWTLDNYNPSITNHANTIVGYDDDYGPFLESDNLNTYGAFKVVNSWGKGGWEHIADGFYYISYECLKQRVSRIHFYQNLIDYIPKMVTAFELNNCFRHDNVITFGLGNPNSPTTIKCTLPGISLTGGNIPYPDHPMVVDITEFIPNMSTSTNQFFMSVHKQYGSSTANLNYFSVEMYDEYEGGIPKNVYVSTETPMAGPQQDQVKNINIFTSLETIFITYPSGGEIFDIGSNPTIKYVSTENSGYVNIEYSTDAGTTWNFIAANVIDNGEYKDWIVPNIQAAVCKIRISDADGYPSSISKGLFRIGPYEFTEQTTIPLIGIQYSSVAWGDYNNDGYLDLLLSGGVSKIYRNNGNNTFTEQTSILLPSTIQGSVAWGDYDNDSNLDILLTGNGVSKIFKNNGDNSFTEQTSISLTGVSLSSAVWGDYDNDGDLDILLAGSINSEISIAQIYRNNSDNTFTNQTTISIQGVCFSSVDWGDYDNDNDLDILISGSPKMSGANLISKIYRNNGNNSFSELSLSLPGVYSGTTSWGDYDNDGYLDILLTGSSASNIFHNNGDNTFSEISSIILKSIYGGKAAWGDYDNDGYLDILLSGWNSDRDIIRFSRIYKNNKNNTFTEMNSISIIDLAESSISWGDYDNDNDLDVILTGNSKNGAVSKIYRNNNLISNTLPDIPSNLRADYNGDDVRFSWNKSNDNETPQNGLTYNIVIETSPGAGDILSPMADRNTGQRRIVKMGNTGHCNSWTIKELPYGKYYWSVQAIDNAFAGSNFAATQSFTINQNTPIITLQPLNRTVNEGDTVSFIIEASCGGPLGFQWWNGKGKLWNNGDKNGRLTIINSENSSTLTIVNTNVIEDNINQFLCEIKNLDGYPAEGYWSNTDTATLVIVAELFPAQTSISLGDWHSSVDILDYDNDDDFDILINHNINANESKIFRNDGNDTFTERILFTLIGTYSNGSSEWGDYDNDRDLDILLTGHSASGKISKVYRNDGNDLFTDLTSYSPDVFEIYSTSWGDYDNDGDLDILLTGGTSVVNYISIIFRNDGNDTFTEQPLSLGVSGKVSWGDYDNDSDLDILMIGLDRFGQDNLWGSYFSKIFQNNEGLFTLQEISLAGVVGQAAWGDYDNDGDLDILLTGYNSGPMTKIYRNDGNNIFIEPATINIIGVEGGSSDWGDYDNDGDLDILLTGCSRIGNISKVYRNMGNDTFEEQTSIYLPYLQGQANWIDYDNDGDMDILMAGYSENIGRILKIYRNNSKTPNTPPNAPSNLQTAVDENDVTFTWDKSTDNETQQNGLKYNLSIGTHLDSADILSPMSDLISGYRRVINLGNTNHDTSWTIKNIPDGKYYWSVQAIDNCFAGSKFAERKSFIVSTTQYNIDYKITLPNCDSSQTPLVIEEGNFSEGQTIKFPEYNIPNQYSAFQPYYNSLEGAELFFPSGSLNENIKIEFIVKGMCENGLIDNPDTEEIVEVLYLSFKIIGDSSGSHNPLEYYYFIDDKEGYLKIPISNIDSLMELLNYSIDSLCPFFADNGLVPNFEGIRKEIDENYYTIYFKHLSEIKLGVISSPTSIKNITNSIPTEYKLEQNYPNPFNPTTIIKYSIPSSVKDETSKVKLIVYDVLGKEVETLVNENISPGYYEVTFNASNLSSGIYFYRLQCSDFTETKKMFFIK